MAPTAQMQFLGQLILAARDFDAHLRNILTDPKLLGASRTSSIGKCGSADKDLAIYNIPKLVHSYCKARWGFDVKRAIKADVPLPDNPQPTYVAGTRMAIPPPPAMPKGWDYRQFIGAKWQANETR